MLERIPIPSSVDQLPIPTRVERWIDDAYRRIEAFQDRWDRPQIEQFVAADYALVYQSLEWTLQNQLVIGNRFLEWGCGFAVVSVLAASLNLDVVGIEAEAELLSQGRQTIKRCQAAVELAEGNFLPRGSERLAAQADLPSIGHPVEPAYDAIDLEIDDFAIVYSYPWPGEDDFHEAVFDHHAARGAMLMLFVGPNDVRLWRKIG